MTAKNIILAGSSEMLAKLLPKMESFSNLNLLSVLTESAENLPAEWKKIYFPLSEYNALKPRELKADWLFHLGSNTVFNTEFLDAFHGGAINAHPGILPDYAGMFPYQWAIRNDEIEAGATLHWITEGLDTGPIALKETFKIYDDDTGLSIYTKCMAACLNLTLKALKTINSNEKLPIVPQDKFKRKYYSVSDALASEVDWSSSSRKVFNFIRAGNFRPGDSPSYTAKSHFQLSPFPIFSAQLGERALGVAGMVSSLKEGIHVVCGDGFTVVLASDTEIPPLKVGDILG